MERYPLKNNSLVGKKTLNKLNKKYGPVNKKFVKGESNSSRTNESVNIGHFSDKKLKEKLDAIETMPVETKKKRNNRNGKIGVKKHNNYTLKASAPRKTCSKCDSVNHLSTYCKIMVTPTFSKAYVYAICFKYAHACYGHDGWFITSKSLCSS